jgi:hypothetical protein
MTRVRLPPDPNSSCITTIVDSQGADSALVSAVAAMSMSSTSGMGSTDSFASFLQRAEASRMSTASSLDATSANPLSASAASSAAGIDNVDSIILVYDLDRVETFFRLENHWLPLIERCYNGEVDITSLLMSLWLAFCHYSVVRLPYTFFCSFFYTTLYGRMEIP